MGWNRDAWQKSPEHQVATPPEADPVTQQETREHPPVEDDD